VGVGLLMIEIFLGEEGGEVAVAAAVAADQGQPSPTAGRNETA
jgi:hypothetical protein